MNPPDPRCQTALGRAVCHLLHAERPPVHERTATREFLRPARGPHNALECRILAGCTVGIAALITAHFLGGIPPGWRVPLALVGAPILLQIIALAGILLARCLPESLRPAAISNFLLTTLCAGTVVLLPSPWTRWPAVAWLVLCFLNLACATCERLSPPPDS